MEQPRSTLRRSSSRLPVIVALGLAVVLAAGGWWLLHRAEPPPVPEPTPAATSAGEAPATAEAPVEPSRARSLLEEVSPNPLVRRGLSEGDVVRRWAIVTDNLAEGVSPRKQLEFLAPSQPFSVLRRDGRAVIAPASYHRYDAFADAVASVDAGALARAYRGLHGALEAAYRALGYPNASLDRETARALRRIAAAPVRDGEVELEGGQAGLYAFADPRLEELGQVEKHLLRMGPRNERLVQAKARELLQALAPPVGGGAATGQR